MTTRHSNGGQIRLAAFVCLPLKTSSVATFLNDAIISRAIALLNNHGNTELMLPTHGEAQASAQKLAFSPQRVHNCAL